MARTQRQLDGIDDDVIDQRDDEEFETVWNGGEGLTSIGRTIRS